MRLEESEADMKKRLKANREHSKKWEAGREDRVGTWRDFAKGNKSKKVIPRGKCAVIQGAIDVSDRRRKSQYRGRQRPMGILVDLVRDLTYG